MLLMEYAIFPKINLKVMAPISHKLTNELFRLTLTMYIMYAYMHLNKQI